METKAVTSTAVWYHISSASGDSSSRWIKGAARKGIYNGKSCLSMVVFDLEEIQEAIGSDALIGADMVMKRDQAYGTDAVTVCVAPAMIQDIGDTYMSRSQCAEMAMRQLHKCIMIEGETAMFVLPGAMLREIKAGHINALLLYQERDGTEGYCRLADSATLNLYTGAGYKAPAWTRTVIEGNVISSDIYSHVADLRELEYYINMRREEISMSDMPDIGTVTYGQDQELALGTFAGWPAIIRALQDGAEGFAPDTEWTEPVEGETPKANIINELRRVIGGDDRQRVQNTMTISATQGKLKESDHYDVTKPMSWRTYGMSAGTKISTNIGESGKYYSVWLMSVCAWLFDVSGVTPVTSAALEINIKESEKAKAHITLYGIKVSDVPETEVGYYQVFDTVAIGEGEGAAGDTVQISINADGIAKLNAGTIHGIGIRYDNDYATFDYTAHLMVT